MYIAYDYEKSWVSMLSNGEIVSQSCAKVINKIGIWMNEYTLTWGYQFGEVRRLKNLSPKDQNYPVDGTNELDDVSTLYKNYNTCL